MKDSALPGISVVTLGVADMARAERFYTDGFGLEHARPPGEVIYSSLRGHALRSSRGMRWLATREWCRRCPEASAA